MSKGKKKINWAMHAAFVALKVLKESDERKMSLNSLMKIVGERKGVLIPSEMKKKSETTVYLKWVIQVRFYCQIFDKAEFLDRKEGIWTLTPEGADILTQREDAVIAEANKRYGKYLKEKKEHLKQQENNGAARLGGDAGTGIGGDADAGIGGDADAGGGDNSDASEPIPEKEDILSKSVTDARTEIENYIHSLSPESFQELCAVFLQGMGYHVRHVATSGPDGGIDVIAYKDLLGCPPRIKLQAKRYTKSNVRLKVITDLAERLIEGDVGIVVSASGFSKDCSKAARNNRNNHIELIDITRFVGFLCQNYDNLSEKDKSLLPMRKVYFLDKKGIEKES